MKTLLILSALTGCIVNAYADPILVLSPTTISGAPGADIGWGFSFTSDATGYYSITAAFLINETNSTIGSFADWISSQGGPVNNVLAPSTLWTESYDPIQLFGIGQYSISSIASPGSSDTGDVLVEYDIFSDDPNVCGSCYLESGTVTVPFEVDVTSVTSSPEPGSLALFAIGLAAVWGLTRTVKRTAGSSWRS